MGDMVTIYSHSAISQSWSQSRIGFSMNVNQYYKVYWIRAISTDRLYEAQCVQHWKHVFFLQIYVASFEVFQSLELN